MPSTGPAAEAFAEGTRRFKARDYLGAIEAYEKAYRLKPHYIVQCNIARCHERTNDMIQAAKHFASCLKQGARRQRVGRKVRQSLRRVKARISRVKVRSPGKGGVVYLDGARIGRTPKTFKVNPGRRIIEVRRDGAAPASTTIRTRGGERRTLELVPIRRRVGRRRGVRKAGVSVYTPEPRRGSAISPVVRDRPRTRSSAQAGASQAWFWTCAAVTVGLAAAATVVGVQALNLKSDYEEVPTRAGYNEAKDRRLLANLLWGGTLLAGAGTTLLFFFTDFGGSGDEGGGDDDDDQARVTTFGVGLGGVW
jgi:PEGA domain